MIKRATFPVKGVIVFSQNTVAVSHLGERLMALFRYADLLNKVLIALAEGGQSPNPDPHLLHSLSFIFDWSLLATALDPYCFCLSYGVQNLLVNIPLLPLNWRIWMSICCRDEAVSSRVMWRADLLEGFEFSRLISMCHSRRKCAAQHLLKHILSESSSAQSRLSCRCLTDGPLLCLFCSH